MNEKSDKKPIFSLAADECIRRSTIKYILANLASIYKMKRVSMEKDYRRNDKISSKTFPIKRVSGIFVSIQTIVMDLMQVKKVKLKIP